MTQNLTFYVYLVYCLNLMKEGKIMHYKNTLMIKNSLFFNYKKFVKLAVLYHQLMKQISFLE